MAWFMVAWQSSIHLYLCYRPNDLLPIGEVLSMDPYKPEARASAFR